jgi:hypothetical protein
MGGRARSGKKDTLMSDSASIEELTARISAIRDNLRQLVEQAAGSSGAADEDRTSSRIAEQELELARLAKRRDDLLASRERGAE